MNPLLNTALAELLAPSALEADPGFEMLSLLVDALAHGVMVVGEKAHLFHVNQTARAELNRHRLLGKVGGEIQAVLPANHKTLMDALQKAAGGKRSLISLSAEGVTLSLAVVPLKKGPGVWDCRIALLFGRAEVCESGMVGFFARSHGLTPTEEQVLIILCRGLSAPEIAVQMKVAVSTVRSHIRSLCAKTSASGVRELVNRVALLPPVAPLHLVQIH